MVWGNNSITKTRAAEIQSNPMLTGFRRNEQRDCPYACTKPKISAPIETPKSQGRKGSRMRAAPAAPAANRNVPTGRQQLTAAARLPSAAIDDTTGPRACIITSIFTHCARAEAYTHALQ